MKRLLPYIFSFFSGVSALAQSDSLAADTTIYTKPEKIRFVQPAIYLDYGKVIATLAGMEQKYEGGISFLFFNHFMLSAELGSAVLKPENAFKNGSYTSKGHYYRMGGGYLDQISAKSSLGLGVYYASSSFDHSGEVRIISKVQNGYYQTFARNNLQAHWLELLVTSESKIHFNKANPEARINQLLVLGFNLRLRIMSSYDHDEPFDVYSIPGFGKPINNPVPALNLFIKIYPF